MSTSTRPRQYAYGEVLHKYMLTLYKACKKTGNTRRMGLLFQFQRHNHRSLGLEHH